MPPLTSRKVGVIGAGPAGLVAARELCREGHEVVVFEKEDQLGGNWVYTQAVDSDPLGVNPARLSVHSSLYSSLRTNLPRESMGFNDFPFVARSDGSGDPRRFPSHREVLMYLKEFARVFGVEEIVRFGVEVVKVWLMENNKWKVRSRKRGDGGLIVEEVFDAVVVCNGGRYLQPHIADIPGVNAWPGKQMHSHNYRIPEHFRDQVVILVGNSFSSADISREMAGVVKEVHVASKDVADGTCEKHPGYDNMWLHSMIESAHEDGTVVFRNGRVVLADVIVHCTGYDYRFPFLETNGIVTVDDNRVGPLYKHVFPPALAPWLSFVGITWKTIPMNNFVEFSFQTIPFPMFELQSKWIAGVLSGRIMLPSQPEMIEDVKAFYSTLEASGKPKRHTHDTMDSLYEYSNWLGAQCGCPGFAEWRIEMVFATCKNVIIRPEMYRDEWEDHHLLLEAQKQFIKYSSFKT